MDHGSWIPTNCITRAMYIFSFHIFFCFRPDGNRIMTIFTLDVMILHIYTTHITEGHEPNHFTKKNR